jgi:hypothetical protein
VHRRQRLHTRCSRSRFLQLVPILTGAYGRRRQFRRVTRHGRKETGLRSMRASRSRAMMAVSALRCFDRHAACASPRRGAQRTTKGRDQKRQHRHHRYGGDSPVIAVSGHCLPLVLPQLSNATLWCFRRQLYAVAGGASVSDERSEWDSVHSIVALYQQEAQQGVTLLADVSDEFPFRQL